MARSANQKLKLLYLMRYLLRNSDENHPVTVRQMGEYLRGQGISAERKSLYDDIEALQQFGLDIIQSRTGISTATMSEAATLSSRSSSCSSTACSPRSSSRTKRRAR